MQTFTQHEKDFVVEFLADILHGLTINNVQSRQEYDGFVRMQDALEVMDMLKMLYNKHKDDGEDTDWEADVTLNKLDADYATLAERVTGY